LPPGQRRRDALTRSTSESARPEVAVPSIPPHREQDIPTLTVGARSEQSTTAPMVLTLETTGPTAEPVR
jgi:hypothetical protein